MPSCVAVDDDLDLEARTQEQRFQQEDDDDNNNTESVMSHADVLQSKQKPQPESFSKLHLSTYLNNGNTNDSSSNSNSNPNDNLYRRQATASIHGPTQPPTATSLEAKSCDLYRLQLYNYALNIERLRCPQYSAAAALAAAYANNNAAPAPTGTGTTVGQTHHYMPHHHHHTMAATNRLAALSSISLFPQRIFQPEEPKPQHSYIGLIAMAILSSPEQKLVLSDIYQYILDNYSYFRSRGPGWRNSIRHNLSLNDCFIKSGRSANGKGHYWAIHPANLDDFRKGDFRRRKAQRKVRKHMGLSVDDAGTDSPSPPPLDLTSPPPPPSAQQQQLAIQQLAAFYPYQQHYIGQFFGRSVVAAGGLASHYAAVQRSAGQHQLQHALNQNQQHTQQLPHQTQPQPLAPTHQSPALTMKQTQSDHQHVAYITTTTTIANLYSQTRKRQFDVASLLAPDVHVMHDDEDKLKDSALNTRTETMLSVEQRRELIVELEDKEKETEVDADIDVVYGGSDVEADGEPHETGDDNFSYLSDARRSSSDTETDYMVSEVRDTANSSNFLAAEPSSLLLPSRQDHHDTELHHEMDSSHIFGRYYMAAAAARRISLGGTIPPTSCSPIANQGRNSGPN